MRTFLKTLSRLLGLTLLAAIAAADWGVHQPRRWQQAQAAKLPPPLGDWALRLGNAAADTTDALGLTGRDVTAPLPATLAPHPTLLAGAPRRLPGGPARDDITLLNRTGFTVGYSPSLRHPVWVAYRARAVTNAVPPARPSEFKPDPEARGSPLHKEYAKSGFDRGHMAPNHAIATAYGKAAQAQTFLTSNVCPQRPSLNQGPWYNLEFRIAQLWPERYGDIWVITGAVSSPSGKRLPSGIDIPSAFYQIVVARENGRLRALAVYMPQQVRRRDYARAMLTTVDELEALTGLDFLPDLPDDIEAALESAAPTRLWPVGPSGALRLLYERFRRYD